MSTPTDAEAIAQLASILDDPAKRLSTLYKIITKGDDEDSDGLVVTFKPNRAQRKLLARLWHRSLILKARQLGFSTLICILWLDTAAWAKEPMRCAIVAQDRETAEELFAKVTFAYDQLPDEVRALLPLKRRTTSMLEFAHNGSKIIVRTSVRGGTIHRLHISEFGKICAKAPDKAREVVTGSIPAVPKSGICVIESTAEGQEGKFYEFSQLAQAAEQQRKVLTPKDWRFHFYPWWDEAAYTLDPKGMVLGEVDRKYILETEAKIKRRLTPGQWAWYFTTRRQDFSDEAPLMWQEYPSCIAGDVLVGSPNGIRPIREVVPDGQAILAHMNKGVRPIFEVRTALGYTVRCTDDHPIKTPSGEFRKLKDGLSIGDRVVIGRPMLSTETQAVSWSPVPFVDGRIDITPEFAEFLGVFMGDGSFYNGTVSVACDAGDTDMVEAVEAMFGKFLGGSASRVTGSKRGCVEVRKASVSFAEPMLALGIVERRANGGLKRKVHVPAFIFQSPREVVAAFLRGLFEADGFAARDGTNIKFFSKYRHVVQEVQLLLLALGIESRVASQNKKSGAGPMYEGWELVLRANAVRKFAVDVGFISARKQGRADLSLCKRKTRSAEVFDWTDAVAAIEPAGEAEVFDITTATHEFEAGGIVVHNCPEEAFQVSTEGCYYSAQLARARKEGRILPVLPVVDAPVNTFWDIGRGDMTAIWFHQRVGPENRFIRYYENSGEDLSHYVDYMQKTGFVFGRHYLPHEAAYKRMGKTPDTNKTLEEMLLDLMPGAKTEVVPRISTINAGIQQTRQAFASSWFCETGCAAGLARLANYRKTWNKARGCWSDEPMHDDNSHGADGYRQFGQVLAAGNTFQTSFTAAVARPSARPLVRRRSGMAV